MSSTISFTPLAEWLTLVVGGLKKVLWVRMGDPAVAPLIALLWNRLSRLTRRFDALVARLDAGQPAAPRRQRSTRPARAAPEPGTLRLPRERFWLIRLLPHQAAAYGSQLQALLADPRTAALLAAAPEAGRILRPLCRLLAIHPEGLLALPSMAGKPAPKQRVVKPPPPTALSLIYAAMTAAHPEPVPAWPPDGKRLWWHPL